MVSNLLALLLCLRLLGFNAETQTLSVSAYTNSGGAHPYEGLTASGEYTKEGFAACGPSYSFGTLFFVPPLERWFVCKDRGSAITDGHLDLWFATEDEALELGRRDLEIIVVLIPKQ